MAEVIAAPRGFWLKVDMDDPSGCWLWKKGKTSSGYGAVYTGKPRRTVGAHRVAYEAVKGRIPDGLHIDHLCSNPPCVNPDHLEPVTPAENARRTTQRNWREARAKAIDALGLCDDCRAILMASEPYA